jgi:tetratricopeptide (TPR) repeat protein
MTDVRVDCSAGRGTDAIVDSLLRRTLPRRDPTDLIFARQALDHKQYEDAERHLRQPRDIDPESAEVQSLMGVLHERLREHHADYQCYKTALKIDRHDSIARAGLRRYCDRFGLDFLNKTINPALD